MSVQPDWTAQATISFAMLWFIQAAKRVDHEVGGKSELRPKLPVEGLMEAHGVGLPLSLAVSGDAEQASA